MDDKYLTIPQVMERLNLGYNTICRYIKDGMLPIVLVTRNKRYIREQDLEKYLQQRTKVYKK